MIYHVMLFVDEGGETFLRNSYCVDLKRLAEVYCTKTKMDDTTILSVLENGGERILNKEELKKFKELVHEFKSNKKETT